MGQILHRRQAARIMGCSVWTVKSLHGKLLHPTINAAGVYEYTREEVDAARAARGAKKRRPTKKPRRRLTDGEKAAQAFLMFEDGESLKAVVTALEETPGRVRAWRRDYDYGYSGAPTRESQTANAASLNAFPILASSPLPPAEVIHSSPLLPPDPDHEKDLSEVLEAMGLTPKEKNA